jgi:predicted dehydrogenase
VLRAAIVGCGKIADAHAAHIQRVPGCELVAVCDREELMARQLQERFGVKSAFRDLDRLLKEARPDVVHITTPPQTHHSLALQCLEHGCHVYVEKPFALYFGETEEVIRLATTKGLKVTVGHDAQFSQAARRLRAIAQSDYLGGGPVHLESYYGYELGGVYGNALLEDKNHWVRRLPGKLLHNIISHGIARIAEYLVGDAPRVIAHGFSSPLLRSAGENEIVDEVRVIIVDDHSTTAYFTFSSQMRPALHHFRVYGRANGLFMDEQQQIVLKLRGKRFPSYAEKFIPSVAFAWQYLGNFFRNSRLFLRNDFHMDSGKKHLIASFYRSIQNDEPLPIPTREILLTARIMDLIFSQLGSNVKASPTAGDPNVRSLEISESANLSSD